ncbi:hypothetical protein BAUCODRAFT_124395 [Baudoinia panamericana UAMH 10762]|uniref:Uncharacterized protein n=1 Tax=Baudoinia panamericana (strain UAMH 10762) TaxID=717646 RepID=M2N6T8_BAUPA|nr:uncharacterized protein BAUCODRAFT_124395 [Baudoinia panamericana UAMH 10762]EMC94799.1 hypothetical protein BAUCODRAFT_124395 [Baudoinia panamericana UAMH 10762]
MPDPAVISGFTCRTSHSSQCMSVLEDGGEVLCFPTNARLRSSRCGDRHGAVKVGALIAKVENFASVPRLTAIGMVTSSDDSNGRYRPVRLSASVENTGYSGVAHRNTTGTR